MTYQDLNLKKIREDNELDFAHFTFMKNMCTCCYDPLDFPARYWRGGIKPTSMNNVQYLLFKNADNGSGVVKKTDKIKDYQCIAWRFPEAKLKKICSDLRSQLGKEFVVLTPPNDILCILAIRADKTDLIQRELEKGYVITEEWPMSPETFEAQVRNIIQNCGEDYEMAHDKLDELLCQVLEQNGYHEGVNAYRKTPKW